MRGRETGKESFFFKGLLHESEVITSGAIIILPKKNGGTEGFYPQVIHNFGENLEVM